LVKRFFHGIFRFGIKPFKKKKKLFRLEKKNSRKKEPLPPGKIDIKINKKIALFFPFFFLIFVFLT